ncbi:7-carboxy-7-deazaguanine synthase [compost metagenome]
MANSTLLKYICVKVNQYCNLQCIHCRAGSSPRQKDEIHYGLLIKFLDELIANGLDHVNITGGEPTLYSKINDLISHLLLKNVYVTITTNGLTKFSRNNLQAQFTDTSKLRVRFSIDGGKQKHEIIRGENTFRRTIKNLKNISTQNVWTAVNTVIYNNTIDELPQIFSEIKDIKIDEWALISPVDSKNEIEAKGFTDFNVKDVLLNLQKAKTTIKNLGFDGNIHLIDFYSDENAYLFVNEEGKIVLPAVNSSSDILISDIYSYKLENIYNHVEDITKTKNKTYFNW